MICEYYLFIYFWGGIPWILFGGICFCVVNFFLFCGYDDSCLGRVVFVLLFVFFWGDTMVLVWGELCCFPFSPTADRLRGGPGRP